MSADRRDRDTDRASAEREREAAEAAEAAADAPSAEPVEMDERTRALADEIEREGWTGSPLVVHGDQVVGGLERYEAARFLGMEDEVPRVGLDDVFSEAGMDMPQIASQEGGAGADEEFFEDYLRDLPRHLRDKYEI